MNIQKRFDKLKKSETFNRIIKSFGLRDRRVLDIGCGYGEYLANFGNGSAGITTTLSEVEYGKDNNLDIMYGNAELIDEINFKKSFNVIWANNFFEHILSPHSFLIKLKKISNSKTILILGVPVIPRIVFLLYLNKFKGALATSHINFFTRESLKLTVERAGWKVKNVKSFVFGTRVLDQIFTLFFSPHIYIIAENDINFKYNDKKLKEWEDNQYYKKLLDITGQ